MLTLKGVTAPRYVPLWNIMTYSDYPLHAVRLRPSYQRSAMSVPELHWPKRAGTMQPCMIKQSCAVQTRHVHWLRLQEDAYIESHGQFIYELINKQTS